MKVTPSQVRITGLPKNAATGDAKLDQFIKVLVDTAKSSSVTNLARNIDEMAMVDPSLKSVAEKLRKTGKLPFADIKTMARASASIAEELGKRPLF